MWSSPTWVYQQLNSPIGSRKNLNSQVSSHLGMRTHISTYHSLCQRTMTLTKQDGFIGQSSQSSPSCPSSANESSFRRLTWTASVRICANRQLHTSIYSLKFRSLVYLYNYYTLALNFNKSNASRSLSDSSCSLSSSIIYFQKLRLSAHLKIIKYIAAQHAQHFSAWAYDQQYYRLGHFLLF